ncbi:Trk system potassium transporter TrkA [Halodesulfurarchaeum formicicum]|uniref:Trk system potassium transporter TrkA n=1 Tax=Halodesulfurarchaeum formicicum TaxID=1873524 RepID=UPI0009034235|nr:Trk system potassium transporter TrkA [Halodesulfurarchaeum formicicum]
MRILIVGAGEVGSSIAANLAATHEVVVIEQDPVLVEKLNYSLDVLAVQGDGTDLEVLRDADIDRADMVIAATDSDETNIVISGTAKTVTDTFTIARVKRRQLLTTWEQSHGAFGVDFMVCSDLVTAEAIYRISAVPHAHDVDEFSNGLVQMVELKVDAGSPVVGKSVREADQYDSMTFAAIFRDGELIVVTGETTIQAGDSIVVIGSPSSVRSFANESATEVDEEIEDVVVIGGSKTGHQTARVFEEHGYRPRLIEKDRDRARYLAEELQQTTVLESDATDVEFLAREHVGEADVVVVCLESDEKNLLVSLLARKLGAKRTVAIVETADYSDLFEAVGVNIAVDPRMETAEEIVRFTREGHTEKVAMLQHDRAEVLEVELDETSPVAGRKLVDVVSDLPDGVVIGAISRDGTLLAPRGETVFQTGDHVIIFVDAEVLNDVVPQF